MPRHKERPGQVGDFWLSKRRGSEAWCRTWYDGRTRQTSRESLGTEDFSEAKERLVEWFLNNHRPRDASPNDIQLEALFIAYYNDHAKALPSEESARISLNYWREFFAGKNVSDLTPDEQRRFVEWLRKQGKSSGYISRILSVGRAALRRAVKFQQITSAPFIFDVENAEDKRSKEPKGRPLSIEEMAALFNAAKSEHVWMFLMTLLNTLCRPDAALDLMIFQADREHGLLDLNPTGRKQTKKFRPIVPITRTLAPWLVQPVTTHKGKKVKPTHLIHYHGGPIGSMKTAWRKLREEAGFMVPNPAWTPAAPETVPQMIPDRRVNPYSIRHTMGRELRKRRVPAVEISLMLGHLPKEGSSTSLTYAPYDPDYCRNAIQAIDDYCAELKRLVKRPMKPPFDPALRVSCVLEGPGKASKQSAK